MVRFRLPGGSIIFIKGLPFRIDGFGVDVLSAPGNGKLAGLEPAQKGPSPTVSSRLAEAIGLIEDVQAELEEDRTE